MNQRHAKEPQPQRSQARKQNPLLGALTKFGLAALAVGSTGCGGGGGGGSAAVAPTAPTPVVLPTTTTPPTPPTVDEKAPILASDTFSLPVTRDLTGKLLGTFPASKLLANDKNPFNAPSQAPDNLELAAVMAPAEAPYSYTLDAATQTVTVTVDAGYVGQVGGTYIARDKTEKKNSAPGDFNATLKVPNEAPALKGDDLLELFCHGSRTFTDADITEMCVTVGGKYLFVQNVAEGANKIITDNGDGTYLYTPSSVGVVSEFTGAYVFQADAVAALRSARPAGNPAHEKADDAAPLGNARSTPNTNNDATVMVRLKFTQRADDLPSNMTVTYNAPFDPVATSPSSVTPLRVNWRTMSAMKDPEGDRLTAEAPDAGVTIDGDYATIALPAGANGDVYQNINIWDGFAYNEDGSKKYATLRYRVYTALPATPVAAGRAQANVEKVLETRGEDVAATLPPAAGPASPAQTKKREKPVTYVEL